MVNGETPPATSGASQLTTLTIRINKDLRAQLDFIAQLTNRSATEEIRLAIEQWIAQRRDDPEVRMQAEAVQAQIDHEAQTRRNAIAAMFGSDGTTGGKTASTRSTGTSKRSQ